MSSPTKMPVAPPDVVTFFIDIVKRPQPKLDDIVLPGPGLSVSTLTFKQRAALLVIQDCQAKGFTPTIDELMEAFQLSKNSIIYKLAALERKGYIKRQRKPRRTFILKRIDATPDDERPVIA